MSAGSQIERPDQADDWHAFFDGPISPGITRSIEAIRRDMPKLLKKHRGNWVAYHGDECVGFGRREAQLYQKCLQSGLTLDDFFVGFVEEGAMDWPEEYELACEEK